MRPSRIDGSLYATLRLKSQLASCADYRSKFFDFVPGRESVGSLELKTDGRIARTVSSVRSSSRIERYAALLLCLLIIFGFDLRLRGISDVGLAEDEARKIEAVRAYRAGDITANAEHPMLMKSLILISLLAAEKLNSAFDARISDEAAVRFPNLLFGALTALPIFLLSSALFNKGIGLIAAALWSTGINAITYNRIAKEDTLLVFFMLFAFYFYLRAKQMDYRQPARKRRAYILSGLSFGLMLASKYLPHYFGLNMLYHHLVHVRERKPDELPGRTPAIFYFVMGSAFLLANPAVLLPETWHYLTSYTSEQLLTHHGYLMGERLYPNQVSSTPFGTPIYFYLLFLAIKTPLPLLAALLIGLVIIMRRWREPGPAFLLLMFLFWIVPYSLIGAKWLRYALSLMAFVYMIAAVGIAWIAYEAKRALEALTKRAARVATIALTLIWVFGPLSAVWASGPHYGLYVNRLYRGRAGYYFPHDELYDDGLREALLFVCRHAPPEATIAHETPSATRYYLERYGRTDLRARPLSAPDFSPASAPHPTFFILQRGRTYFENRAEMAEVRATAHKVYEVVINGVTAAEVYVR
jgi:hypothetical protein